VKRIFYSWQADRANTTGRNLVQRALLDAISMMKSDADVEDAERDSVRLDSDTQGVPGSPPIVETIFAKIDASTVFIADLTFVGQRVSGRPTPNPNVAIEYGYALKALSHSRIVGVMNAAHGAPTRESLPFDLGHMRHPITYNCPDDADEDTRRRERKGLAERLRMALKVVLDDVEAGEASLSVERKMYQPLEPCEGRARFRNVGDPIGSLHDGSPVPQPDVPVGLSPGPVMWLRVLPKYQPDKRLLVTQIREALVNGGRIVSPLNGDDLLNAYGVRGPDGYGLAHAVSSGVTPMLVYVFTSGEVWSIDAALMSYSSDQVFFNPANFVSAIQRFSDLLGRLGVGGPYRWVAGIEGMKNRRLQIDGRAYTFPPAPCLVDSVVCQGEFSGDLAEAGQSIEPFVAEVFDAGHLRRS
jgi:hypothetical protein